MQETFVGKSAANSQIFVGKSVTTHQLFVGKSVAKLKKRIGKSLKINATTRKLCSDGVFVTVPMITFKEIRMFKIFEHS